MAINRYDNPYPVQFDDIDMFLPNPGALAQAVGGQQDRFDRYNANIDARSLNALSKDFERAESIRGMLNSSSDEAANVFVNEGVAAGNKFLKNRLRDIDRSFRPGGEANAIQSNYNSYVEYVKGISDMADKGTITQGKKRDLIGMSLNRYQGIGDQAEYNTFSGIGAVEDIDLPQRFLDIFDEFVADKVNTGELKLLPNGQYYNNLTEKRITKQELMAQADVLKLDPKVSEYLAQERARLEYKGLTPEQANEVVQARYDIAANFGAEAKSFTEQDYSFHKNHDRAAQIDYQNKKRLVDYQYNVQNRPTFIEGRKSVKLTPDTGSNYAEIQSKSLSTKQAIEATYNGLGDLLGRFADGYKDIVEQAGVDINDYEGVLRLYKQGAFSNMEAIQGQGYKTGADIFSREMDKIERMMSFKNAADTRLAQLNEQLSDQLPPEQLIALKTNVPVDGALGQVYINMRDNYGMTREDYEYLVNADPQDPQAQRIHSQYFDSKLKPTAKVSSFQTSVQNQIRKDYNDEYDNYYGNDGILRIKSMAHSSLRNAKVEDDAVANPELVVDVTNQLPLPLGVDQMQTRRAISKFYSDPANQDYILDQIEDPKERERVAADMASGTFKPAEEFMITKTAISSTGYPYLVLSYGTQDDDENSISSNVLIPTDNMGIFDEYANQPALKAQHIVNMAKRNGLNEYTPVELGGEFTLKLGSDGNSTAIQRWSDGNLIYEDNMTLGSAMEEIQQLVVYKDLEKRTGLTQDQISEIYDMAEAYGINPEEPVKENDWDSFGNAVIDGGRASMRQMKVLFGDEFSRGEGYGRPSPAPPSLREQN